MTILLREVDPQVNEGRNVLLRPIDWHRVDDIGRPMDVYDLNRLYSRPENEWRFCSGQTMTPFRMQATIEDKAIETQRIVSPIDSNEVLGHLVASHADYRHGRCDLSVILATEHPYAVEAIPLFLDLLFTNPYRNIYLYAPEYNAAQFWGHLVQRVLGEPLRQEGDYVYDGAEYDRLIWQLTRAKWENSGFAHGGYLDKLSRPAGVGELPKEGT